MIDHCAMLIGFPDRGSRDSVRDLDLEHLAHWAARKGVGVVGTGAIATLPFGGGIEFSSLWLATVISLLSAVAVFRTV